MRVLRYLMPSAVLLAGVLSLCGASAAAASTGTTPSVSTNWSGYVAHGVKFRRVSALWTQPKLACTAGQPTFSAAWVGLGGYRLNSKALEQVGTEADCTASGREVSDAWYELVPAPSRQLKLIVDPGDVMGGRVSAVGDRVTVMLSDHTRHRTITKTFTDHTLDISSADWILEAPSECGGGGFQCQPLTLADFGSDTFARASAQTRSGKTGPITSKSWPTAMITLSPSASQRRFAGVEQGDEGSSSPSPLSDANTSFTLTYTPPATPVAPPPVYGGDARSVLPRQS